MARAVSPFPVYSLYKVSDCSEVRSQPLTVCDEVCSRGCVRAQDFWCSGYREHSLEHTSPSSQLPAMKIWSFVQVWMCVCAWKPVLLSCSSTYGCSLATLLRSLGQHNTNEYPKGLREHACSVKCSAQLDPLFGDPVKAVAISSRQLFYCF